MGVVADGDGRHWRQQAMRIGRWVTSWENMTPFASVPVDVAELTKAEKHWLDIKFRRRVLGRKTPTKTSPGRHCTTGYWSSRPGKRGVKSRRVTTLPQILTPPPGSPVPRSDSGRNDPVGPADPDGRVDAIPPEPRFLRPPPSSQASLSYRLPGPDRHPLLNFWPPPADPPYVNRVGRGPVRRAPFINGVLRDHGTSPTDISSPLRAQLRAVLTDEVLASLPPHAAAEDLPDEIRTAMGAVLRAAETVSATSTDSTSTDPAIQPSRGLVDLSTPKSVVKPMQNPVAQATKSPMVHPSTHPVIQSATGSRGQESTKHQDRARFILDILNAAGLGYDDVPDSFLRGLMRNILALQRAGQEFSAEYRAQMSAVAVAAAAGDTEKAAIMPGQNRFWGTLGEDPRLEPLFARAGVPSTDLNSGDTDLVTTVLKAGPSGRRLSPAFIASLSNFIRGVGQDTTNKERRKLLVWVKTTEGDVLNLRVRSRRLARSAKFDRLATDAEIAQIRLEPGVVPSLNTRLIKCIDPAATGEEVYVPEAISHHYIRSGGTRPLKPVNAGDRDTKKGVPITNMTVWDVAIPDDRPEGARTDSGQTPVPVFIDAAQAAADQSRYWIVDLMSNRPATRATTDPGHFRCPLHQMERIQVQDGDDLSSSYQWVNRQDPLSKESVWVREDRADQYLPVDIGHPDFARIVTLRTTSGTELRVAEALVGALPEHSGAVIINCDPEVAATEKPSTWSVSILFEDQRLSVPCNKLGDYFNAAVSSPTAAAAPVPPSGSRTVALPLDLPGGSSPLPVPLGRTIDLVQANGIEINVPVADVDNFKFGGATIVRNANPPAGSLEQRSGRTVWITLRTDKGVVHVEMDDNLLELYEGATIRSPNPIPPNRFVDFATSGESIPSSVPVERLSNELHQGNVIACTKPAYDPLEMPSERQVHIKTVPDMLEVAVPDNQVGRYPGARVLPPPPVSDNYLSPFWGAPIRQDRLILMKLADGRQVRVPVASVCSEYHGGATIAASVPGFDSGEPESTRTVAVTLGDHYCNIPDNSLGFKGRGGIIDPIIAPARDVPTTLPLGQSALIASADNGAQLMPEQIRQGGFMPLRDRSTDSAQQPTTQDDVTMQGDAVHVDPTVPIIITADNDPIIEIDPMVEATPAQGGLDDAETNVDYPQDMMAPEYIKPAYKPWPNGRPDENNPYWNQPRPSRGDPMAAERIVLRRERQIRDHMGGMTSLLGSMTPQASGPGAPAEGEGKGKGTAGPPTATPHPRIHGMSSDNARDARASPTTAPRTLRVRGAQGARQVMRSAKAERPGRWAEAGPSVRFGPLPTEEELGRRQRGGLRTRSGALYRVSERDGSDWGGSKR